MRWKDQPHLRLHLENWGRVDEDRVPNVIVITPVALNLVHIIDCSSLGCSSIGGVLCQKQVHVSRAGKSNYSPQNVGCNYLSLPFIPVSGTTLLIWYLPPNHPKLKSRSSITSVSFVNPCWHLGISFTATDFIMSSNGMLFPWDDTYCHTKVEIYAVYGLYSRI